jgi:zinc transporter ZupT
VAGDSSFGARLAGMVIGLAVLVAAGMLWWLVTRSRSRLSLDMFVLWVADRLAFKRLGTAGRPTLACLMAFGIAAMVFAVVQQPQLGTDGNVQHPAYAVVFFALVVLVTAGRLKRRV